MSQFTPEELDLAVRSLSSTIRKLEKVLTTLSQKHKPNYGQIKMVEADLKNHRLMLALVQGEAQFSDEDLAYLPGVIHRYVDKIEAVLPKFAPGTSQHTLGFRRITAYEMALTLAASLQNKKV